MRNQPDFVIPVRCCLPVAGRTSAVVHRLANAVQGLFGWRSSVAATALLCVVSFFPQSVDAGLVGGLSALQDIGNNRLQSVFSIRVMSDLLPTNPNESIDLDLVDLDIVHSKINGVTLTDFSKFTFKASGMFEDWQESESFGVFLGSLDPLNPSKMSLDAFSQGGTQGGTPRTITDTDAFVFGTFTIDYSSFGLGVGDSITLDITGDDDGQGSRTTSGVITTYELGNSLPLDSVSMPFDFTTSLGPGIRTFTFSNSVDPPIVPEPASSMILMIAVGIGLARRRRRSFLIR